MGGAAQDNDIADHLASVEGRKLSTRPQLFWLKAVEASGGGRRGKGRVEGGECVAKEPGRSRKLVLACCLPLDVQGSVS